jgi:hypothetical protein
MAAAATAAAALQGFIGLSDRQGNLFANEITTIPIGPNAGETDQVIKNISKVKAALDAMYVRGRGAMSYEEVFAKYNAAGNTDTMTLPELVRLFSPSDSVFNSIDDAVGIAAFKLVLDADPGGNAAALARAKNIVRSINEHLQTAMPEIIFSECNVNGAGAVIPGVVNTLTYGPATVTTAPGDVTFKVYGLDARNLGLNDGGEKKVKKTYGINPTGQFDQTPLNCLRLEHLTLLEGSKLARSEQASKAFVITGANSFKNTCVCFAFSHPDGSTKFECPVDPKFVTLPTGCKIFIRYPDRAVIYTSNSNTSGSVDPPPGFKFKIRISKPDIFRQRNAFNTYMGQEFRRLTGCNVLNNPSMLPRVTTINDCAGINVAGKTYGFSASASINGNTALALINNGPIVPITINVVTGVSPDDTAAKLALRTLARIYSWEYMNAQSLAGADLFQQHFGGKKNITNKKYRNVNKRQRRSKSKSKSMSMLKSAKRTFYRTNKRNKTSKKY